MPHRVWKHRCTSTNPSRGMRLPTGELVLATEACEDCGQTGTFDGWLYSMTELMGCFQNVTGFKPLGPHRQLTDDLLKTTCCSSCAGRGIVGPNKSRAWKDCPDCDGNGYYLTGTPEEIAEIRRRIRDEFPDSWVGGRCHPF